MAIFSSEIMLVSRPSLSFLMLKNKDLLNSQLDLLPLDTDTIHLLSSLTYIPVRETERNQAYHHLPAQPCSPEFENVGTTPPFCA